jgi:hypothetical protein
MAPVLSRRERDRSLSHRSKLPPVMITTVRLFNPYVTSIVGEKLFQKELDELSNVIKDNRAKLGSMREKTETQKALPTTRSGMNRLSLGL